MTELELQLLALREDVAWPPTPDLATAVQARVALEPRRARRGAPAAPARLARARARRRGRSLLVAFGGAARRLAGRARDVARLARDRLGAHRARPDACPTSRPPGSSSSAAARPSPQANAPPGQPDRHRPRARRARRDLRRRRPARRACRSSTPRDPGLPPGTAGVGALLDQLQGDATAFIEKFVAGGVPITPVRVNGERGYFIGGRARGQPPRRAAPAPGRQHRRVAARRRDLPPGDQARPRGGGAPGRDRRLAWAGVLLQAALNGPFGKDHHPAMPVSARGARARRRGVRGGRAPGPSTCTRATPTAPSGSTREVVDAVVAAVRDACGVPVGVSTGAWIEPDLGRRLELIGGLERAGLRLGQPLRGRRGRVMRDAARRRRRHRGRRLDGRGRRAPRRRRAGRPGDAGPRRARRRRRRRRARRRRRDPRRARPLGLTAPRLQHGDGEATWILLADAVGAGSTPGSASRTRSTGPTASAPPATRRSSAPPGRWAPAPSRRRPGAGASRLRRDRRRLASTRRALEPAVGLVGRRARGTSSAWVRRARRRSSASSRLRAWLRASCATARTTGPQRAMTRAFCASLRESEAATSKMASTRDSVTLACWPPGPDERLVRSTTSRSGTATSREIHIGSSTRTTLFVDEPPLEAGSQDAEIKLDGPAMRARTGGRACRGADVLRACRRGRAAGTSTVPIDAGALSGRARASPAPATPYGGPVVRRVGPRRPRTSSPRRTASSTTRSAPRANRCPRAPSTSSPARRR